MVTPGNGTGSIVPGPSVPRPNCSDLKSEKRSGVVTWSNSGVSALYICACAVASAGIGTDPCCPDGMMLRATCE